MTQARDGRRRRGPPPPDVRNRGRGQNRPPDDHPDPRAVAASDARARAHARARIAGERPPLRRAWTFPVALRVDVRRRARRARSSTPRPRTSRPPGADPVYGQHNPGRVHHRGRVPLVLDDLLYAMLGAEGVRSGAEGRRAVAAAHLQAREASIASSVAEYIGSAGDPEGIYNHHDRPLAGNRRALRGGARAGIEPRGARGEHARDQADGVGSSSCSASAATRPTTAAPRRARARRGDGGPPAGGPRWCGARRAGKPRRRLSLPRACRARARARAMSLLARSHRRSSALHGVSRVRDSREAATRASAVLFTAHNNFRS